MVMVIFDSLQWRLRVYRDEILINTLNTFFEVDTEFFQSDYTFILISN